VGGTSGSESSHENGDQSNGCKDEPFTDDLDEKSALHHSSPVPGTSKSSDVRRRSLKEPKRNSPDAPKGQWKVILCCSLL